MGKNDSVEEVVQLNPKQNDARSKHDDVSSKQDDATSKQDDASSKIETIRNLIFGENIKEYNSEFETLKSDILNKKKILEDLIEEVRQDVKTAIDNVAIDANIRITELENKIEEKIDNLESDKVDRNTLGKMLMELGEKVSQK